MHHVPYEGQEAWGQEGALQVPWDVHAACVALREGRRVMPAEGAEAAQSSAPVRGRLAAGIV